VSILARDLIVGRCFRRISKPALGNATRYGPTLTRNLLRDGKCPECGAKIDALLPITIRAYSHNMR